MEDTNRLHPSLDAGDMSFSIDFLDEKQLSSDLERLLQIRGEHSELLKVKVEQRDSCRYGGTGNQALPDAGAVFTTSNQSDAYSMTAPTTTYSYPDVKPELVHGTWHTPCSLPGMSSLSSRDLETDDISYMATHAPVIENIPVPQKIEGFEPLYGQSQLTELSPAQVSTEGKPLAHYPHDQKLIRFEEERNISVGSEQKQQKFAESLHLYQQQPVTIPPQSPATETMADEESDYCFELDENCEGPLHILSAVTDKTSLSQSLFVLQECKVVPQCINLQNKYKQTPLFLAVQSNNLLLVAWLLDNGADPNIQGTLYIDRDDYIWRSPLHLAVMMGEAGFLMVSMLLSKARTLCIDLLSHGDKLTALHLALKLHNQVHGYNCQQTIMELIEKGADTNIRDQSSSKTPCMMVVETRDLKLIQDFLDKFPADQRRRMLQEQTRAGDTCLHLAAGLSRIESPEKVILLRLLVTNGANGNIPNNVKEFPKDFARYEWNQLRKT